MRLPKFWQATAALAVAAAQAPATDGFRGAKHTQDVFR